MCGYAQQFPPTIDYFMAMYCIIVLRMLLSSSEYGILTLETVYESYMDMIIWSCKSNTVESRV